jgi:hypothetical protein
MTWTWMCTFVRHDELRRAVTSFEFRIVAECICCISDVMIDIIVITLHVLKRGCVKSCGMTSCDVSRGDATRFEFWIAVKSICRSTDVIIEIFGCPFTWVDVYIRVAWWAARCREVLWRALNFVKRRKKYMLYCRCNDWTFLSSDHMTCNSNMYFGLVWRAATCHKVLWRALHFVYCGEKYML